MSKDVESGESVVVKQRVIDQNVKIALVVGFYFAASMALVFLNKRMFSVRFPCYLWFFVCGSAHQSDDVRDDLQQVK
jgi:hypothetical protein